MPGNCRGTTDIYTKSRIMMRDDSAQYNNQIVSPMGDEGTNMDDIKGRAWST